MPFLQGLLLGLSTAFILGPVFFTIVRNSIAFGRTAGFATALGILASDVAVLFLCLGFGSNYGHWLQSDVPSYLAASLLLYFGLRFVLVPVPTISDDSGNNEVRRSFVQGFLINGVNPVVFGIWLGFIALGQLRYDGSALALFLIAILLGIFATDVLKAIYAPLLKQWMRKRALKIFYRIVGIVLCAFAIQILLLIWI